ncbi:unnamed protein product [Rhizophagus irregularis]|nr:unnamed protein product [Rhizophagus irregularis]
MNKDEEFKREIILTEQERSAHQPHPSSPNNNSKSSNQRLSNNSTQPLNPRLSNNSSSSQNPRLSSNSSSSQNPKSKGLASNSSSSSPTQDFNQQMNANLPTRPSLYTPPSTIQVPSQSQYFAPHFNIPPQQTHFLPDNNLLIH